ADLLASCREVATRHVQDGHADLVWRIGRGQLADGVLEPSRRHVGLLLEECRAPVEPVDDLQGNGRLHGYSDSLSAGTLAVAADRAVASASPEVALSFQLARARNYVDIFRDGGAVAGQRRFVRGVTIAANAADPSQSLAGRTPRPPGKRKPSAVCRCFACCGASPTAMQIMKNEGLRCFSRCGCSPRRPFFAVRVNPARWPSGSSNAIALLDLHGAVV